MTKDEFTKFVAGFKKKPGEFTKDEIFEIGLKHKLIQPASDKSWDWVKSIVGWEGSKDSLRMYVNSRCTPDMNTADGNEFEDEINRLYMERTKNRDIRNSINRQLRDEARVEVLKETILDAVNLLKPLPEMKPLKKPINSLRTETEAIVMLSDLHIGAECDNFYNKYNLEIASSRMDKLADEVLKYCVLNNVGRLNIVNLGDMIHGIIHTSLRVESQTDAVTQVMQAAELVARFLSKVSVIADEVIYRSCSDNHSRLFSDKSEAIENENLGRLIDWYLEERLKKTPIIFSNDNIDYSLGKFTLLNGKKVMFAHGHNDSINRSFEAFVGASREFIDYGLLAHYHSEKSKSFQGFKVFVNGSIVGTEQYALSRRLFNKPSQTMLIFGDSNIINITIDLEEDK